MRWYDLALVGGTTVVNRAIEPIIVIAGGMMVFYGIGIVGVARLLDLEVLFAIEVTGGGCALLLSLVFYKNLY